MADFVFEVSFDGEVYVFADAKDALRRAYPYVFCGEELYDEHENHPDLGDYLEELAQRNEVYFSRQVEMPKGINAVGKMVFAHVQKKKVLR